MADAMVTARMSSTKKEAGNRMLERLGTNASQAVNDLYDYVVENGVLPWQAVTLRRPINKHQLANAMKWAEDLKANIPADVARMTTKDAKRARLGIKGQGR